jgi:hypothetical protein
VRRSGAAGSPRFEPCGNSLRAIAADLAVRGYVNVNGRAFSTASIASMLGT